MVVNSMFSRNCLWEPGGKLLRKGALNAIYIFLVFYSIELEPKYGLLIVGGIYQVRQLLLEYSSSNLSHFFNNGIMIIMILIKPLHYFCRGTFVT